MHYWKPLRTGTFTSFDVIFGVALMPYDLMKNNVCVVKYIIIDKLCCFMAVLATTSIYLSISFLVIHQSLVCSRHSCRFVMLSAVEFLSFITLSTCFSHFTSGHPWHLPPSAQVIICLSHLLSSMHSVHTISKYCFPFSPKFCYPYFFLMNTFRTFNYEYTGKKFHKITGYLIYYVFWQYALMLCFGILLVQQNISY